ncbi:MAG: hypothetical protein NTW57_06940 [Methylophilales bacterium]|nr:hypothetical protein [Methylophilales bacterium]
MKNVKLNLAVLGAFSALSMQAFAAPGFVNVPGVGFATSAYTTCNDTGDFGSGASVEPKTQAGATRICATFPNNGATDALKNSTGVITTPYGATTTTPVVGFTLARDITTAVVMNNTATGGVNKTVANIQNQVWKDAAGTSCIYATRVHMNSAPLANGENWELNDVAYGGFSAFTVAGLPTAAGALSVAYWRTGISDEVTFRAGRTFSAVQHHSATAVAPATPILPAGATLPPKTPALPAGLVGQRAIVGVASTLGTVSPWLGYSAATTQSAPVDANWVDFTTDNNFLDPDGSTFPDSSMNYIRVNKTAAGVSGCPSGAVAANWSQANNAIRLRSTGQENQTLIEVAAKGFVPGGSSATTIATPNP